MTKKRSKPPDTLSVQLGQAKPCDLASGVCGHEQQEQPQGIPIALNTGRLQTPLALQVIFEKRV